MKRVLLDHCVPKPLRKLLTNCAVSTAYQMGWARLENGDLLNEAQAAGFEILITSDKNLRYQQNLTNRVISIIELPSNDLVALSPLAPKINAAISGILVGSYVVV